jgi:hypothetical protein
VDDGLERMGENSILPDITTETDVNHKISKDTWPSNPRYTD